MSADTTWVAGYLDGDGSVTISTPGGEVVLVMPDRPDLADVLYEIRAMTVGRVDVRFIDADGYETIEST